MRYRINLVHGAWRSCIRRLEAPCHASVCVCVQCRGEYRLVGRSALRSRMTDAWYSRLEEGGGVTTRLERAMD